MSPERCSMSLVDGEQLLRTSAPMPSIRMQAPLDSVGASEGVKLELFLSTHEPIETPNEECSIYDSDNVYAYPRT